MSRLVISIFVFLLLCSAAVAEDIYFAAEKPPDNNAPSEASLCYKFLVSSLEEQLGKLKVKYENTLYDEKIVKNDDGSRSLLAKRKDESGKEIQYFYSNSPIICNRYQQTRLGTERVPDHIFTDADLNEAYALKTIFGNYDREKKAAIWKANAKTDKNFIKYFHKIDEDLIKDLHEMEKLTEVKLSNTRFLSESIGIKTFIQRGVQKALMVIQTSPERWQFGKENGGISALCGPPIGKLCSPVVGAALFSRISSGWKLDSVNKYILEIGEYGSSPPPKFQQLGKETVGIVLEDVASLSFQPIFTWINIIGIIDLKIDNLLTVEISAEYPEGVIYKDEINYESEIKYIDKGNVLYDLEIHTFGTNKKGKSIDKITKYKILGNKYVKY